MDPSRSFFEDLIKEDVTKLVSENVDGNENVMKTKFEFMTESDGLVSPKERPIRKHLLSQTRKS